MIKLIASDMDGTLLNKEHDISKENLEAIKKVQAMGIHFAIATGRDIDGVKPILEKHNLKCECILSNGAEYRDVDGNIIEAINIEKNLVKYILDILKENKIMAELYTSDGIYTNNSEEEVYEGTVHMMSCFNEDKSMEEIRKDAKKTVKNRKVKYIKDMSKFLESSIEIRKIFAFYMNTEIIEEVKLTLEKIEGLAVSSSFVNNIEITNIDAQKGPIIEKAAKKMNINKDEVLVLGDSFNDKSMFETFIHTVAMDNALPEIKQMAKYITDTNNNAGVAKAIYNVLKQEN